MALRDPEIIDETADFSPCFSHSALETMRIDAEGNQVPDLVIFYI
jgi:hypothetical protein